ncbi:MAG TPA: glycosyltransferase [Acidobacteriaceae bacterium]|nr:glycosyltransferase [Acidobacteriaceae bacterium]
MDCKQKIILVSPFFYPELISTGKANQSLAEAFAAEGHSVTVVCSHPVYPAWVPVRSDEKLPEITILRGGSWVRYPRSMPARRMLLELWFAAYACCRVWRLRKQADLVVSVLPPSLFALLMDRALPRSIRRVAVIHDLQGLLAAQERSVSRRAIIRTIHSVEERVFQSQNLCIFFSVDMAQTAKASYRLNPERIAVQYPCITLASEAVPGDSSSGDRLESILPSGRVHVVYSGALGYKQNPRQLVALLQSAAQHFPDAQFHVFSGGPFFEELRGAYSSSTRPHVQFHPLVEEQNLVELYARSAIQVIPQAEGTEAAALPSKLPNLLAAGVQVLAICRLGSEVERLLREAGTGTIVEKWEETLFLKGLSDALDVIARETPSVRRNRVAPLLNRFSISNMVRLTIGSTTNPAYATVTVTQAEANSAAVLAGRDHEG